jgi:hypothetical protein
VVTVDPLLSRRQVTSRSCANLARCPELDTAAAPSEESCSAK